MVESQKINLCAVRLLGAAQSLCEKTSFIMNKAIPTFSTPNQRFFIITITAPSRDGTCGQCIQILFYE